MVDNYERAKGESSEWRTPASLLNPIGLRFRLDPCAPLDGYYCVPAKKVYTERDDGLVKPWGDGLVYVNPPWSERRGAVVPWLRRFFTHDGGGIFVCVARTSCDWFHQLVLPNADLLCFPTGKTRFIRPDGSPGPSPTNGITLIARGKIACEALRRSGLGYCTDRGSQRSAISASEQCWCALRSRGAAPFYFKGEPVKVVGIDPGIHGGMAIVVINDGAAPQLADAIDIPTVGVGAKERVDVLAVRAWILSHQPQHALIKRAQAMPRQGASSGFKYGRATGALEAVLACCEVPTTRKVGDSAHCNYSRLHMPYLPARKTMVALRQR